MKGKARKVKDEEGIVLTRREVQVDDKGKELPHESMVKADDLEIHGKEESENTDECKGKTVKENHGLSAFISPKDAFMNPFLSCFPSDNPAPFDSLYSLFHDSLKQSRFLVKLAHNQGTKDLEVFPISNLFKTAGNVWKMKRGNNTVNVQVESLFGSQDLFQFELYMADASLLCPWDFSDILSLWEEGGRDFLDAERVKQSYIRLLYLTETLEAVFSKW